MHIEEISDEVAERLKLSQAEGEKSQLQEQEIAQSSSQDASAPISAAVFPEPEPVNKKSIDEIVADLKKTPFFMTELEENDQTEAFKALAYEGTPLENGSEFKERGNECFREKRWADAKEFYTKGVLILAAEERKRVKGEHDPEVKEEEVQEQKRVLESLYINRAACHLELKNYRSCWLDCAAALRLNDKNLKAYYRSARAFLAVGRIAEADDACARGLALDENNGPLKAVARDIVKKHEEVTAKQKKEAERLATEKRREILVKVALKSREIKTRTTAQPPEMEDAGIRLVPDPDDPRSALSFPTVLLYPAHLESDFIKAFEETAALADHLSYVFPLPWDVAREYTLDGVECYMETAAGGLVKVGKKVPLLKMLAGGKVEVVDEVVRVFVLPKARAAAWVLEFKEKRRAERGGG
ncbi:Hsp70/Hsp90 co-chaperone cns1 [Daldinia childiae]|uniref:Hsp70/Hsp90 co-chaperone cns1 n=1 Tax=Daldinia childiae TaxID=326645 RepID=UPI0014480BE6|nr:Hsp70/Hsp90 co-chaperone cns1 [Daldinia childiae]KAF3055936.1 Hsp70/Hsp90 co-chaperone cns1 [Daldinia childiae]